MKRFGIMVLMTGFFLLAQPVQAQWTPAKRITWTSADSWEAAIAIDSKGNIHVVWWEEGCNIFYKRSTDCGTTWSPAQRLTWTWGASICPAIAIDSSDTIHLVWMDNKPGNSEIYHRKSADGGTTWSTKKRLTWTSGDSWEPALDSGDHIHVCWYDYTPGNAEIHYMGSADGGMTWSAIKRLTWTWGDSLHPAIDSNNHIHVIWEDNRSGSREIYYRKSSDGGTTWSADKRLTRDSGESLLPAIAIDSSGAIHCVWVDWKLSNTEICYRRSTDGGTTWSAVQRLTWTSGWSWNPAIAIDSKNAIHVVWYDNTPGNCEIYHKRSADGGTTWSTAQRLTWTSGYSTCPAIAIDSTNTIHVVWEDETPGNYEIYYLKGK